MHIPEMGVEPYKLAVTVTYYSDTRSLLSKVAHKHFGGKIRDIIETEK
jgi:hypothetical protein